LLFMPIGSATTASGADSAITLTRQDGWSWSCRQADRTQYDGAEAQWHDPATGQRRTHKTGGTNRKRLASALKRPKPGRPPPPKAPSAPAASRFT
jgi:phage protein D